MTIGVIPWSGKRIAKPGFYSGVSMKAYHSGELCVGPSLSSSGHRAIFIRSEAHYFDKSPYNPDRDPEDEEESEAFTLGRATHHLLLGQPHFQREFVVTPTETEDANGKKQPWSMRFDSAKLWVAERKAEGLTVLTMDQMVRIRGMAWRLGREPLVQRGGVLNGLREITMVAFDVATGIWILSRPDVIPTDGGDFCDVKTTARDIVSYSATVRAIGEYGYHQQASLCGECWRALTGRAMATFSFYFVESKRPHCARMFMLRDSDLVLGDRQNRNARRRFVAAMNTGVWPGPGGQQEAVQRIDLSDSKRAAIESELRIQGEAQ